VAKKFNDIKGLHVFNRTPRNEKWETIRRREARNDVLATIFLLPLMYILLILGCAL